MFFRTDHDLGSTIDAACTLRGTATTSPNAALGKGNKVAKAQVSVVCPSHYHARERGVCSVPREGSSFLSLARLLPSLSQPPPPLCCPPRHPYTFLPPATCLPAPCQWPSADPHTASQPHPRTTTHPVTTRIITTAPRSRASPACDHPKPTYERSAPDGLIPAAQIIASCVPCPFLLPAGSSLMSFFLCPPAHARTPLRQHTHAPTRPAHDHRRNDEHTT